MSALAVDLAPTDPPRMQKPKRKLVADLFCGAGGTSKGAKLALAQLGMEMELVAVNHWPVAVETHRRANPTARHYCQDIATLRPQEAVPEGYLDLLMASPTCTHHSRARGGKPTSDQQRMDPWHVVTWCTELRVKRLLIENVPEYVDWGPVDRRTGRPVQSRKGEYFRAWIKVLEGVGFKLRWGIVNAADCGDATTRERFMLMGRSDGKRLRGIRLTHTRSDGGMMFDMSPWRSAREIIDWALKGRSIYGRPVPLKFKTLKRIESGLIKLGGEAAAPYLPRLRAEMERSRWYHGMADADRAAYRKAFKVAAKTGTAECTLSGETFLIVLRGTGDVRTIDRPLPTVTASGKHLAMIDLVPPAFVFPVNQSGDRARGDRSVDRPMPTILTRESLGLVEPVEPFLFAQQSNGAAKPTSEPLPALTTCGRPILVQPFTLGQHSQSAPRSVDEPLMTIAGKGAIGIVNPEPFFVTVNHGDSGGERSRTLDAPVPTITGSRGLGLVQPFVTPYYGSGSGETGKSVDQPLDTITAQARFGLIEPFIVPQFGEREGQAPRHHDIDAPLPAATGHGAGALVEPMLVQIDQHGSLGSCTRSIDRPIGTLVTKANVALVEPVDDGYDILFRMVQNPEIARATGFDDDETDYEFAGTKAEVTKQIGNAVPVNMAKAHILALMAD